MLVRNAMYKIKSDERVHLFHVNEHGDLSIAMYRNDRGGCEESTGGKVHPMFFMFRHKADQYSHHNHWIGDLLQYGKLVASHVVDPGKLTSRQLRKMARK
ncbi:hypothetical protein JLBYU26_38 [Escherichia phage JLBYU26]|uniref:Uncharacterized protein n=1 Tax=Escherichia phage JLBYU26 TaxID=2894742 RepID=A0AAE9CFF3_9CAUD|nr:hypothetical protein JLBYU26_38 [Escherichia phage JLBYU26]